MRVTQPELGGGPADAGLNPPVAIVEAIIEIRADVVLVDPDRGARSQGHRTASGGPTGEVVTESQAGPCCGSGSGVRAEIGDELCGQLSIDGIRALNTQ